MKVNNHNVSLLLRQTEVALPWQDVAVQRMSDTVDMPMSSRLVEFDRKLDQLQAAASLNIQNALTPREVQSILDQVKADIDQLFFHFGIPH